jgi:hypothetical protein
MPNIGNTVVKHLTHCLKIGGSNLVADTKRWNIVKNVIRNIMPSKDSTVVEHLTQYLKIICSNLATDTRREKTLKMLFEVRWPGEVAQWWNT